MTIPGKITDLRDVPAITSASQIGLIWTKSTFISGSQVTDFKVEYDQATNEWVVFETDIQTEAFTATQLTAGLTY